MNSIAIRLAVIVMGIANAMAALPADTDPWGISFPNRIEGGLPGLKQWVASRGQHFPGGVADTVAVDRDWTFVLLVHSPFSGRRAIHPYVYGCSRSSCDLALASRVAIDIDRPNVGRPVRLHIPKDRRAIEVRGDDGAVYVRVVLPKK